MLDKYQNAFARLRIDRSRGRYPNLTNHSAPHKPFLLLSIIDLIAQGKITENFIALSFELVDTWNGYWNAVMPIGQRSSMAYPFPRLRTDGFWHLEANPGFDPNQDYNVSSMRNGVRPRQPVENILYLLQIAPNYGFKWPFLAPKTE